MSSTIKNIGDLNHEHTIRYLFELFHRIIIHHALWFSEVEHQMGTEQAFETLSYASERSFEIQIKRFSKIFVLLL